MSVGQFWAALRAAWWRIALMVVVATSVAFALASAEPKQYTAKARVMLNIDNDDPYQYSALQRDTEGSYIGSEMHLVTEDGVMRDVVAKLGWADNPQVITAWQAATGGAGDAVTWAAHQLAQGVQVAPLPGSSILEIYYSSTSLDAAKGIVGLIRTAYIEESARLRAEAARRASAWNRTQAAKALVALQAAAAARASFVTANSIAVDTPAGGLDYQAQQSALVNSSHQAAAETTGTIARNPVADGLERKLNELDADIAVVRLRGEANPVTVALETQRTITAQQLARERSVGLAGPHATLQEVGLVRAQRDADFLKARLNLLDRSPLYDRLATMDREIMLKGDRFNAAAARVTTFDTVAAAPAGVKVIGDVIASDDPTFPNVPLMTGIAAGASFALACAVTIVAELSRRQVRNAEDLQFFTGAPVLAVVADATPRRWRSRGRPALFGRRRRARAAAPA